MRLMLPLAAAALLAATAAHADGTATTPSVTLHGQRISVEFATNNATREHGLMMRTVLPADHGMLFVFPDLQPLTFWMKNTLVPLDILFFDDAKHLVSMQLDAQPCKADPCALYPSNRPARYALELPAGTATRIGAQVGDTLTVDGDIGPVQ